jgi:hypothetical protein
MELLIIHEAVKLEKTPRTLNSELSYQRLHGESLNNQREEYTPKPCHQQHRAPGYQYTFIRQLKQQSNGYRPP